MIGLPRIHHAWAPLPEHNIGQDTMWFLEFLAPVPHRCDCGNEHGESPRFVLCAWLPWSGHLSAPISV